MALLLLVHLVLFSPPLDAAAAAAAAAFVPKDNFLINCGGNSTVTSDDGRAFRPDGSGDTNSSFALSPISHDAVVTDSSDLHGSARVFTQKSAYSFGIGQMGRHFLRLHFRPLASSRYDLKSAVFSVAADEFILFHNFSYSESETVIQTYRRDLEEFRSGLKEETAALRTAAARVVRGLPVSLEAGAAAAQESLEAVGQAVDDLGGSVVGILSHSRGALLRPPEPPGPQKAPETSSKQYSRFEAQVLALQRDQKTFLEEPEDAGDFENWRSGFELAEKGEEIERLGSVNGILKRVIEKLVPDAVDCEIFWSRYYYKIHRVQQAEDARARLIRSVISREEEEEDLSWEVDEEEQEVKEQKKEAEMRGKEEDKVVEKGNAAPIPDSRPRQPEP